MMNEIEKRAVIRFLEAIRGGNRETAFYQLGRIEAYGAIHHMVSASMIDSLPLQGEESAMVSREILRLKSLAD